MYKEGDANTVQVAKRIDGSTAIRLVRRYPEDLELRQDLRSVERLSLDRQSSKCHPPPFSAGFIAIMVLYGFLRDCLVQRQSSAIAIPVSIDRHVPAHVHERGFAEYHVTWRANRARCRHVGRQLPSSCWRTSCGARRNRVTSGLTAAQKAARPRSASAVTRGDAHDNCCLLSDGLHLAALPVSCSVIRR